MSARRGEREALSFWRRTMRPIAVMVAACAMILGTAADFAGRSADRDVPTLRAQLDFSAMSVEDFEAMLASSDPLFARLRTDEPARFSAYAEIIRDFVVANVDTYIPPSEIMELAFNLGGQLVAAKAETASDELVERFAKTNVAFLRRTFEIDVVSCVQPERAAVVMRQIFAQDDDLAYRLLSTNLELITDTSTTRHPVMSETELLTMFSGPFMTTVIDRSEEMIRTYRPAEAHEAEVEALRNAYLYGLPLAPDMAWLDCVAGAAFLEAILAIEAREERLPALRLFMSFADDPIQ